MGDRDDTKRERPGDARTVDAPEQLARGEAVGRYIVLDMLGAGGMGVVYRAYDPELDRKVAIKLLQVADIQRRDTEPLPGAVEPDQSWLVREAQALARLSHPNVVAVHDVGTLPGRRVFLAMELVEGRTLRTWLAAEPRSWREVVPVLRAAGAGLAAAHASGIVHRDFKPENVIVGDDGRVRVMDFGLADAAGARFAGTRSLVGTIAGTPAYIAPEIWAGADADARTDQFAFGVTLYEALFGARPFDEAALAEPGVVTPALPERPRIPAWLARVVVRAIAIDPAARYASIDALLVDLARDPASARRRVAIAAGGVMLAGGALAVGLAMRTAPSELCSGAGRRLAGVWDGPQAMIANAAFVATGKPFAARSFAGLRRALDDYAAQWADAATETCRATRVEGSQTEEVMQLREDCLGRRLEELRAFTRLVVGAEGTLVDKGDKAVFELEPIAKCANVAALRDPGRPPDDKRERIAAVEQDVAVAKAELIAGRYVAALGAASRAAGGANAVGWDQLAAEALFTRGGALLATGNFPDAAAALGEATWVAVRARRDDLAAVAALGTAMVTADSLGDPEKAKVWLELGITMAGRAGVDRAVELRRYEVEGLVLAEAGELDRAIAAHEKALAVAELAYGKDSPAMWADEEIVATTYSKVSAYAKAIPHYERSLRMREASVGPDQLEVSILLSNLGVCYRHVRDFKRARVSIERALAIREKLYGDTPVSVAPLDNLADLTAAEGDPTAALPIYERGMKLAAFLPGTGHPMYHQIATEHAQTLVASGRLADAHAAYAEVLALEEASHSPFLPTTQSSRAELALAEHAWPEAASWAERAIAGFEAKGGATNPALWLPLTRLAEAKLGAGDRGAARGHLERALAIGTRVEVAPADLARTRDDLAKLSREPDR